MKWNNTTPTTDKKVILRYKAEDNKQKTVIGKYIKKFTVVQDDENSDFFEYSVDKDEYYLPEGWYEYIENIDDYDSYKINHIEDAVWLPLDILDDNITYKNEDTHYFISYNKIKDEILIGNGSALVPFSDENIKELENDIHKFIFDLAYIEDGTIDAIHIVSFNKV